MTVPLMIWSALIVIDSQACSVESSIEAMIAAPIARIAGERHADDRMEVGAGQEGHERRDQDHPLDPDVHDAGAFAHDPAQRPEGDRHRVLDDQVRQRRDPVDQPVDEAAEIRDVERQREQGDHDEAAGDPAPDEARIAASERGGGGGSGHRRAYAAAAAG